MCPALTLFGKRMAHHSKTATTGRGRPPKQKIVKKELTNEDVMNLAADYQVAMPAQPSVEISQCISYQKFRYSGENRPGKKYQEKEFMTLKLSNLYEKVVRVVIICTDAENRELIHPNGLVGRDCHDGIYDKEHSITKGSQHIKIPYLRIERIKTKRNEHKKIQSVLQQRALHLPSPYKERCLSQCTDNYTANRKFDTTKVCLGVIVTVISHQRNFNGFLHAISHVVRNANAKTKMGILKLSEGYVPAASGGEIDIFTTEEGPAIEPDKYLVSVSYEGPLGHWASEKVAPGKEDILYKRVIRYTVPPFELKANLDRGVHATLHLECPQSNQYCYTHFLYSPSTTEYMIIDDGQMKRPYEGDEDVKIGAKRMKFDTSEEKSSEVIKANLKTMIKAKQDYTDHLGEGMAVGHSSDGSNQYIVTHDKTSDGQIEQQILVTHLNPQTGESSVLLDMDGSKTASSMGNNIVVNGNSSHYSIQSIPLDRLKDPSFKQIIHQAGKGEQEVQVVAAGYSDAVPPNTVYIYTTNGDRSEHVIDGGEQIVLQEVTDEESLMITGASNLMKNVTAAQENYLQNSKQSETVSAQVVRRETFASKVNGQDPSSVQPSVSTAGSKAPTAINSTQGVVTSAHSSPSSSVLASKFQSATSSPSAIPHLRRMLIPSKVQSSSPWAVEGDEDSAAAYNIVVSSEIEFSGSKAHIQSQEGPRHAESPRGASRGSSQTNVSNKAEDHGAEKPVTNLEFHLKNFVEDADTIHANLPTIQVAEMVKDFENEKEEEEEAGALGHNSESTIHEAGKE